MKNWMGIAALLLIGYITLAAQDFYNINTINTIEITFTEANWDQILDNLYAAGNEERLVGSAVINGVAFDSVGVRYKGNSSYSPQNIKNPLNIKLDQVIDDQTYEGYGTLKLANGFKDPTFIRETLGYEIAAKYGPASKANYINVYVNNELIGLYTSVQSVDKHFCRSFFAEDEGTLIKGNPVGGPGGGAANICYLGSDSTAYYTSYELKSDFGWQDLVDLCYTLNLNTSNIEDILDVDRVLWFLAFHNTLVSNDSPIMAPHNFYLYMDDKDQFNYIYWDLNMTFGTFNGGPGSPPMSVTQLQHFDPFYNINNDNYPIVSKLLSVPEYQKIYIAHMKTILEENFANGWYETRALELQNIIDASVQADQNKFYTYGDFINNIHNSIYGSGPSFTIGITELMEERVNFLNNHSSFNVIEPDIIDISSSPDIIEPNSVAWVTVETENTNSLKIGIRQNEQEVFQKLEMYDDGNHNDVLAGDGIFGIQLDTAYNDIQYYIYAENDDAVKFAPQRAEYEYYTLDVITETGNIVINEINYHSSDNFNPEDWIELYNPNTEEMNLSGWEFKDEDDLHVFSIPENTFLAADDYLVLCKDSALFSSLFPSVTNFIGDLGFGLSGGGEPVRLFDAEGTLIDSVNYDDEGEWPTLPDGNGNTLELIDASLDNSLAASWQASIDFGTPGQPNSSGVSVQEDIIISPDFDLSNYPNPFNPTTTISFNLSNEQNEQVELVIYNLKGQQVKTFSNLPISQSTNQQIVWNGTDQTGKPVSSGVYFVRIKAGNHSASNKILLLK
ncbi:MAG: CotH kinase family protein [Candidatus Cloacimonetes bacterium]|nr:CotH kinase family protein [Candidatus Cloacimonadota bacterium]MCF7814740.1 CotH kinase family protein [Candidatus Cloacimonadota bacterium]MCF7868008.1 CotH kinase family protein [Candidatus Cloacimonadota bacterium]MCF7883466.1 CotH kinase family protein [Candidatus Cloacimonadota bacterium]